MDLVSVVMHELGHVLGFDHDDASTMPVMNGTLLPGAQPQIGTHGKSVHGTPRVNWLPRPEVRRGRVTAEQ